MSAAQKNFVRRNFFKQFPRAVLLFLFLAPGQQNVFAQRPLGCDVSGYEPSVNWN
jgi:hypothetical protein